MSTDPAPITTIALDARSIRQLFAPFDPSPFHDFSLNGTTVRFMTSQAWQAPRRNHFVVQLSIRSKPASPAEAAEFQSVVRDHFNRLAINESENFTELIRTGVIALSIGLCVLAACTAISRMIDNSSLPDGWRDGLRDGISVFGWVANWKPAQILFYDWWPVRRTRNVYRRLAQATVIPAIANSVNPLSEAAPLDTLPLEASP